MSQSPPAEWLIFGLHFLALDWWRSRGEADHDTLSEVVRNAVERHPHGPEIFTVSLIAGTAVLHRHILRPLKLKSKYLA